MPKPNLLLLLAAASLIALLLVVTLVSAADEADDKKDAAGEKAEIGGGNNNNNNNDVDNSKPKKFRRGGKRSIFQACRKDIEALCMEKPKDGEDAAHARRLSLRNAANCLEKKESEVQESTCKTWLHARQTCFTDAEKPEICPGIADAAANKDGKAANGKGKNVSERGRKMMCLRSVDPSKLSQECSESDFYKAIVGLRRFHKKSAAGGKKGGAGAGDEAQKSAKKIAE